MNGSRHAGGTRRRHARCEQDSYLRLAAGRWFRERRQRPRRLPTARFRKLDKILGECDPPRPIMRKLVEGELHLQVLEEPVALKEAESYPQWRAAMQAEMDSIIENGTWHLADLPPGHRAIGLKWVYKVKKDAQGAIAKYQARLVAKGYV